MRIAVIGNSHVASLKTGWDGLGEEFPDIELNFYASRGNRLDSLICVDGVLRGTVPKVARDFQLTSGLAGEIVVANYDAFLICGLAFRVQPLSRELSSAVRNAALSGIVDRSTNRRVVRMIRDVSAAPILVGHAPQVAAPPNSEHVQLPGLSYEQACREMRPFIETDVATLLIEQPAQTLSDGWHTRPEYALGSPRLDVTDRFAGTPFPDDDVLHMNAAFGKLMLLEAFRRLEPFRRLTPATAPEGSSPSQSRTTDNARFARNASSVAAEPESRYTVTAPSP